MNIQETLTNIENLIVLLEKREHVSEGGKCSWTFDLYTDYEIRRILHILRDEAESFKRQQEALKELYTLFDGVKL